MSNNWRRYLDDEYEDEYEKIERIKHPPKIQQDNNKKVSTKKKDSLKHKKDN